MFFPHSPVVWLLLLSVAVQLYYVGYYVLPFARRAPEPEPAPAAAEPVSVLVCAHNELDNLRRLLPLLLRQDYPAGFEIILIDDRSGDDTYLYVQQLTQYYPNVRLVSVDRTPEGLSPKKYALTLGIKTARYEQLVFTDADCIPATDQWLRQLQAGFAPAAPGQPAPGLVIGYSAYAPAPGLLNRLIRYETLVTGAQYLSFAWRGRPYMGVGRNLAYTRACFRATKGFASHIRSLGGDDDLFVQDAVQLGVPAAVRAEPVAHTYTEAAPTWRAWWRQKRRHLSAGRSYRLADRVRVGNFIGANVLFHFAVAILLFSRPDWVTLAVVWGVRTIVVGATYSQLGRRLDDPQPVAWIFLLDAVYFFHYLALGISLFLHRNLRWK